MESRNREQLSVATINRDRSPFSVKIRTPLLRSKTSSTRMDGGNTSEVDPPGGTASVL